MPSFDHHLQSNQAKHPLQRVDPFLHAEMHFNLMRYQMLRWIVRTIDLLMKNRIAREEFICTEL